MSTYCTIFGGVIQDLEECARSIEEDLERFLESGDENVLVNLMKELGTLTGNLEEFGRGEYARGVQDCYGEWIGGGTLRSSWLYIEEGGTVKLMGDLGLPPSDSIMTALPSTLRCVGGDALLHLAPALQSLGNIEEIEGGICADNIPLESASHLQHVETDAVLQHTKLTTLPALVEVGGNLLLTSTQTFVSAPMLRRVGGLAVFAGTSCTSLPSLEIVGNGLNLADINCFRSAPKLRKVDGGISLPRTTTNMRQFREVFPVLQACGVNLPDNAEASLADDLRKAGFTVT